MSKNFAIIGGDLRIVNLSKMLANDGNIVYIYGLEKADELKEVQNLTMAKTLQEAIQKSDIVIGPMPFSTDNVNIKTSFNNEKILIKDLVDVITNQIFIAGSISVDVRYLLEEKKIGVVDLLEQEELAVLNAISTAEGAIQIAMENTKTILHGSNILILGFGRIGKILANKLKALSANVTCAARKKSDFAWIESYGYEQININELGENLKKYDIIFNTVPHLIITKERLKHVKKECVMIELASKPGGFDEAAGCIWGSALPGKVAPVTSAEFIYKTVCNILEELENK